MCLRNAPVMPRRMSWQKSPLLVPHVQTSATGHQATRETVAQAVFFHDAAIALALADHHQHAATNMKPLPATGASADASVDVSIIGDTTATDDWSFQFIAVKDMSWNENLDQNDLKAPILAGSITTCTLDGYSPNMLIHNRSISSSDKPASSGAGSEVRASQAPRPHPPHEPRRHFQSLVAALES